MSTRGVCELDNHCQDARHSYFPEPHPDYTSRKKSEHFVSHSQPGRVVQVESLPARKHQTVGLSVRSNPVTSDLPASVNDSDSMSVRPKSVTSFYSESKQRQALHKELLMNYQMRKDALQNCELSRVLRERRERERKREWDVSYSAGSRTFLEVKLQERANKIKEEENKSTRPTPEGTQTHELNRVHRFITLKSSKSTE